MFSSYAYGITFFTGVRALLHPTFVIKTKIQVSRGEGEKGMLGMARSIVRKDGVRGLYKVRTEEEPQNDWDKDEQGLHWGCVI